MGDGKVFTVVLDGTRLCAPSFSAGAISLQVYP